MKASDLGGKEKIMQIAHCALEAVGAEKENKPVVYFVDSQKPLVLNRTNADRLAHRFGDDTAAWIGATVKVYSELVSYQGKTMEGIRLQPMNTPAEVDAQARMAI
jgi:hypothetical protein